MPHASLQSVASLSRLLQGVRPALRVVRLASSSKLAPITNPPSSAADPTRRADNFFGPIGVEPARGVRQPLSSAKVVTDKCGDVDDADEDDDAVAMLDAKSGEWGGPTRGGTRPEPTRFGDWETKGRCTDF